MPSLSVSNILNAAEHSFMAQILIQKYVPLCRPIKIKDF